MYVINTPIKYPIKQVNQSIRGTLTQMYGEGSPLYRGGMEVSIVNVEVPRAHRLRT